MRLRTAALIVTLALGIFSTPLSVNAQQATKVPRIGFLLVTASPHWEEAFRQGLRDLGWVEGQNIAIEYRWAEGKLERLPDLAAELVRLKVDVLVAETTPAALAAKNVTKTIPIVFVRVSDPVGSGLVASLARPGGNVTGPTSITLELSGKRLELLKEALPGILRVAVLWNPTNPASAPMLKETQVAAGALNLQLQILEARDRNELERAFSALARNPADALTMVPESFFYGQRTRIVDFAARRRLPVMGWAREFVDAGALMSYGPSLSDIWRRAATYVDKILKGGKPADLPVEQPTRFELVINLKTAKALGLTIPQSILIRADHVIQ